MIIEDTKLAGCKVIQPKKFVDARGFFLETYQDSRYQTDVGIKGAFVQDNHSYSKSGVLRGLHFQEKRPQGKLVRVVYGAAYDVAVDIRRNSATYGQWISEVLSDENNKQLWIPPGFAHGFLAISDEVHLEYKCTDYYDASDERAIIWNDPDLKIYWPIDQPKLSEKDAAAKSFRDINA